MHSCPLSIWQKKLFNVPALVLSRVLFLSVLSSLIIAGVLLTIEMGLAKRRRQSDMAKLRQLLASGDPRRLTRMLKRSDAGASLSESSVGRALVGLGVMTNDAACSSSEPQTGQNRSAQPSADEVELVQPTLWWTSSPAAPSRFPGLTEDPRMSATKCAC
jgi:hypothetical protein